MKKVLLLGSSRLHRPFCKKANEGVIFNIKDGVNVVFSKLGYFHTAFEMLQAVRFLKDNESIPNDIRPYIFRVEPRATTPKNEFLSCFEDAIKSNQAYEYPVKIDDISHAILEICSLSANIHYPSGKFLHTNPNFKMNVPYKDIYPEGYYEKYEKEMVVEKYPMDINSISLALIEIKKELPNVELIIMGHLCSAKHPHSVRERVNKALQQACNNSGCFYFDVSPFVDEYGFNDNSGVIDIHHLSHLGELALGDSLQEYVKLTGN